jgi:hypothetical protein
MWDVGWQCGDVATWQSGMVIHWACLLACRSFFYASSVVGSGGRRWSVGGGSWQQWKKVVMWLMAPVNGKPNYGQNRDMYY